MFQKKIIIVLQNKPELYYTGISRRTKRPVFSKNKKHAIKYKEKEFNRIAHMLIPNLTKICGEPVHYKVYR